MKIINLESRTTSSQPIAVALGYFDGLHLGHQAVILKAVHYARTRGIKCAVLTFSTNPKVFLKKTTDRTLLTPLSEKLRLLEGMGVDQLLVLPFNKEMMKLAPEEFVEMFLKRQSVRFISTGFDFRFGRCGAGDAGLLQKQKELFEVSVTPRLDFDEMKIGTTQIRSYLARGMVQKAQQMLGRPYTLTGTVITGNQRGRTIGFPTANIGLDEPFTIPKKGVYAVRVQVKGKSYPGMCNIGHNPTFNYSDAVSVEVNILDFDQDIYGEKIRIDFIRYIRTEQKFFSVDELIAQLEDDRCKVRELTH